MIENDEKPLHEVYLLCRDLFDRQGFIDRCRDLASNCFQDKFSSEFADDEREFIARARNQRYLGLVDSLFRLFRHHHSLDNLFQGLRVLVDKYPANMNSPAEPGEREEEKGLPLETPPKDYQEMRDKIPQLTLNTNVPDSGKEGKKKSIFSPKKKDEEPARSGQVPSPFAKKTSASSVGDDEKSNQPTPVSGDKPPLPAAPNRSFPTSPEEMRRRLSSEGQKSIAEAGVKVFNGLLPPKSPASGAKKKKGRYAQLAVQTKANQAKQNQKDNHSLLKVRGELVDQQNHSFDRSESQQLSQGGPLNSDAGSNASYLERFYDNHALFNTETVGHIQGLHAYLCLEREFR
jgi:hypothetical protein